MQIKIIYDRDIAFSGYLRNIINMERWPWIRRGPLEKVPKELTKKAIKFSEPIKFSFERHPLADLEEFSKRFKDVLKEGEILHNKEWKRCDREIRLTSNNIEKLVNKYGKFISKSIKEVTKAIWPINEVWLIPSIYSGGTVINNKIFLGFKKRPEEACLRLLVHELIHVNTNQFRKDIEKELRLPTDSDEITTVLLTNKIIDKLNKRFGLDIQHQKLHDYYEKFIAKYKKELYKIGKTKRSYKSLVHTIDKFLEDQGYGGYYQKYLGKRLS